MDLTDIAHIVGDRYRVVRIVGRGGMGTVVKAFDPRLERFVAIKVFHAKLNAKALFRIKSEARTLAQITHPHITAVYELGIGENAGFFLVTEFIEGGSLSRRLRESRPAPRVAIEIVRQVSSALAALHGMGVVHRDIKSSNIMLDTRGSRVVLADFGLAGAIAEQPYPGVIIGTPLYMAPEQAVPAPIDARTDLYALGIVLYELLTGQLPFSGATIQEAIVRRLNEDPPHPREVNAEISVDLDRIAIKLLQREPDRRFQRAEQLIEALDAIQPALSTAEFSAWLQSSTQVASVSDDNEAAMMLDETLSAQRGPPEVTQEVSSYRLDTSMQILVGDVRHRGASLLMLTGDRGAEYSLGATNVIGRSPDCDIALADETSSSRRHCQLVERDGAFYLEDMGSRNGTFLNDVQLKQRTRLNHGDRISVGATRMLFIQQASQEQALQTRSRLTALDALWNDRLSTTDTGQADVQAFADKLTHGLLQEALGYHIDCALAPYRGITGYMVEAPMMWISQTRFPILFVPYTETLSLDDITRQLKAAQVTDFLGVLVVVPPAEPTGREAAEVKRLVENSVYRYDLAVLDRQDLARIIRFNDSKTLVELFVEKGIELSRLSPYVVRGPVPENMFFGREAEIKQLSHALRNHAVLGGRRMGKSSMFLRLRRMLDSDPRFCAFYVNCEACFDHDDFLVTLGDAANLPEDIDSVSRLRGALTRFAQAFPEKTAIFLLDEIDELVAFDSAATPSGRLFKTLRAVSHEQLGHFIFSGGRSLHDALHDADSPFFNFCDAMHLSPLSQRSVAEIVRKPMQQLSIALAGEQAIIDRIFAVTSGHPNIVQYLCHRLVHRGTSRRITLDMVEDVIASEAFTRHFVETAWSQATPLES